MHRKIKALVVATAAFAVSALSAHAGDVDPAQALAQKFSEAVDEKPAAILAQPTFATPGPDYEAEMLERARSEENERATLEAQKILATPPVAVALPASTPAPAPKQQAVTAQAPSLAQALTAKPPASPEKSPALDPKVAALSPPAAAAPAISSDIPSRPSTATATVLLVLDPDGQQVGFKPDPILCIDNRCWLSNGFNAPALVMARNSAVALQTTKNVTADSCSGKSGCVFRGVAVDPTLRIDVVEVGEGGGASAGAYTTAADKSCRKDGPSLVCENGLTTQNFRIWVVPETTAELAGASGLENAVAEGLPDPEVSSSSNDK